MAASGQVFIPKTNERLRKNWDDEAVTVGGEAENAAKLGQLNAMTRAVEAAKLRGKD